jgi:hypothetical protein
MAGHGFNSCAGSGSPLPSRRTLAAAILASARSDVPALRHPWLRWSHTPSQRQGQPLASSTRRRKELSAETVGGHAQTQGVIEDYRRLIKTHEFCTLKTTGVEHAYRRLRMRVIIGFPANPQGMTI